MHNLSRYLFKEYYANVVASYIWNKYCNSHVFELRKQYKLKLRRHVSLCNLRVSKVTICKRIPSKVLKVLKVSKVL